MITRPLLAIGLLMAILWPLAGHAQRTAEELYQSGLYQEEAQGNLQGAIEVYQAILRDHSENRAVAAKAQLHIGLCFELLGQTEAERAYQAVLDQYADQAEVASEARARLEILRAAMEVVASEGLVARRLQEDNGCNISFMKPSPDGKLLAYCDVCATMAVHILDLASGATEQLTSGSEYFGVAWSPDGRKIATGDIGGDGQLKVIDLETGDIQVIDHMTGVLFFPDHWSSDGDHISGMVLGEDRVRSTMVVSLSSGERIPLGHGTLPGPARATFSPDGLYVAYADFAGEDQDIFVQNLATGERERVTRDAEADWGAVWSPDGTALIFHNGEGSWALQISEGKASGDSRLLSSVPYGLGQTYNSWTSNGYYYVAQNIVSNPVRLPVDPETAQAMGSLEPIPEPMPGMGWSTQFAWSPDMGMLASTGGDEPNHIHVSRGQSVTSFQLGAEAVVWGMWWSGDGSEILYTTRSDRGRDPRRTVYALDPTDGSIRELFPLLEPTIGFIHVSADESRMVFLKRDQESLTGISELVISDLGNPTAGRVLATSSEAEGGLATQMGQPAFSPDGSHIMFIRIHQVGEGFGSDDTEWSVWVVPADGSAPARQLARSKGISSADWDPSGRWLVYSDLEAPESSDDGGYLFAVSIETGEKQVLLSGEEVENMAINGLAPRAWSPDGRWIGFAETKGALEFWVIANPLDGGSER